MLMTSVMVQLVFISMFDEFANDQCNGFPYFDLRDGRVCQ